MARSTPDILTQLERHLPPVYQVKLRPLLAGWAAALRAVEVAGDGMVDATTVGGSSGIWLTLLARGYGVERATGETDTQLQARLRNVANRLTVASIEEETDGLLASGTSSLIEHWKAGLYLTDDDDLVASPGDGYSAYLDCSELIPGATAFGSYLYDQHNAFTLVLPLFGVIDDLDPVYSAVIAQVEKLRAAGVRWWLLIEV